MESKGILVATDQVQEWLLPWWWDNYSQHNSFPVAFIDFGMTEQRKQWCRERGELIPLNLDARSFVKERKAVDPQFLPIWEGRFGAEIWEGRKSWFKKPFACLQTPFQKTCWIDLDCEIKDSLEELFDLCSAPFEIAMLQEYQLSFPIYNGGVIVYEKQHPLLGDWAQAAYEKNHLFPSDQEILSYIVYDKKIPVLNLPHRFNCIPSHLESGAAIYHWLGKLGKGVIQKKIELSNFFF